MKLYVVYIFRLNDRWEFPRTQLVILEAIGKGAFGEVCKGIARGLEDGKEDLVVAVKQAKTGGKQNYFFVTMMTYRI